MKTEKIVLFPPTHEQSLPTFHVETDLCSKFTTFLKNQDFKIVEPPETLTGRSLYDRKISEILLEEGTSSDALERAKIHFLKEKFRTEC